MVRRERVKPYCLFTGCLPAPPRIPVFCCTTSSSLPYLIAIAACAVAFRFGARTGGGAGRARGGRGARLLQRLLCHSDTFHALRRGALALAHLLRRSQ